MFNNFVETKRPAKGIATNDSGNIVPESYQCGNQKTRQGDCDFACMVYKCLLIVFCGNQKTRQGDCDNFIYTIKFLNFTLWKPRDPPRGLRLVNILLTILNVSVFVETKRPAKGIATSITSSIKRVRRERGNQETRQGDCDEPFQVFWFLAKTVETKRPAKGIAT